MELIRSSQQNALTKGTEAHHTIVDGGHDKKGRHTLLLFRLVQFQI